MNQQRIAPTAAPFRAPTLSPLAALRDRGDEAHEHGARLRDAGFRSGYEAGLQAAASDTDRAMADYRRAAAELARAAAAVEAAAAGLERRDATVMADVEHEVVALAVALAEELVGRELRSVDRPVLDALARAARLLPDRGTPRIRVHPDDEAAVRDAVDADAVRWTPAAEIVADATVERGGCIVDVDACSIDAQIAPAIERMRAALG